MRIASKTKKRLYFIAADYFRFWANFRLKKWNPKIISVTGSVGKTTMLSLIEAQLKEKAHYSHNANSAFGISFDILNLSGVYGSKLKWFYLFAVAPLRSITASHSEKYYVVEIDGERPHETEFLAKWLKPNINLWVSLGKSHAIQFDEQVKNGNFSDVSKAIANEFAWLSRCAKDLVVVDGDNELINESVLNIKAKVEKVYSNNLLAYDVKPDQTSFRFKNGTFVFDRPMPKEVATQLMILEKLTSYLKEKPVYDMSELDLPPGRSSYFEGIKGLSIIDSSYNAHLLSMKSVIEMLNEIKAKNKWLVLGDMVDQGDSERDQHEELGKIIKKSNADVIVLIGKRLKKYTYPIIKGQKDKSIVTFENVSDALPFVKKNIVKNQVILFKGSQYLEWLIEKLLLNKSDVAKLPRQNVSALKRKNSRGL
jgi:UDP-N-acetylmuramoyl-tripeptide--D-alanyl-D-alanine ligase